MKTSYAIEIALDIRPTGCSIAETGRLERWLVKRGEAIEPNAALAVISLATKQYELRTAFSGKVDLLQTEAGDRVHQGMALLQITTETAPPSPAVRLVLRQPDAA